MNIYCIYIQRIYIYTWIYIVYIFNEYICVIYSRSTSIYVQGGGRDRQLYWLYRSIELTISTPSHYPSPNLTSALLSFNIYTCRDRVYCIYIQYIYMWFNDIRADFEGHISGRHVYIYQNTRTHITNTGIYLENTCAYIKNTCVYIKNTCTNMKKTCIYIYKNIGCYI